MTKEQFIDEIKSMSVLDLADIVKAIEEEFGVSAAPMPVAMAPGAVGAVAEAAAEEEQTEFDVKITDIGAKKINVIKAVREVTPLGLKEAKDLVESAPVVVLEQIGKETADEAKEKLEAAGASVELA
ncbi:MAG: 50S ribosomal protein L7/L12 [Chloroflexi bacterium]|nr:50S ribosomal protein L7/L12 [Chloroflexota bacterium]MYK61926.1 50S ribosomal protein L7/L12 [Chloroflexota bacterium]